MQFFKNIFSIKNDNNTCHRIITIFGIKLRLKSNQLLLKKIQDMNDEFNYKLHKFCPAEKRKDFLIDLYYQKTNEILDLDNPKTFNEKIQWLKLYDSTPIKTRLADKYLVREWIKEQIGEEYLIPLLGVWDKFDDIDFDKLPNQFVLKCNHGCGYNIIVKDKNHFNKEQARKQINNWLNTDFAYVGFEMHYSDIPRKIIAEEYLKQPNNELDDYKFYCYNGKHKHTLICTGRNKKTKYINMDENWECFTPSKTSTFDNKFPKPNSYNKMVEIAEKLAKTFALCRVDFYKIDDKIYIGELTFTPGNGFNTYSKEWSYKFGQWLDINNMKGLDK